MAARVAIASIALGIAVTLGAAAPHSASATPRDFFTADGSKDAVFMDMAIRPQALQRDGVTYVAYQGPGLDPYVMAYHHDTGAWVGPYRAGDNPLTTDTHGAPAMFVDDAGFLHVFYGGHYTPLAHARSLKPGDPSAWVKMPPLTDYFTYPQVVRMPDGDIGVFYRGERPTGRTWVYRTSSDGGVTWSSATPVLAEQNRGGWYACFKNASDGTLTASFVKMDLSGYNNANLWGRYDVHFMRMGADGTWRSAQGAAPTLPLTWSTADSTQVFESGDAFANEVVSGDDGQGNPAVLFSTGRGGGPTSFTWKFARFVDGSWNISDVAPTDHFFDCATFDVAPDGAIEVYATSGGSSGIGSGVRFDYRDRGGALWRFTSSDHGATWSAGTRIDPAEPGTLYNHPQIVQDGRADARLLFTEWKNGPSISAMRVYLHGDEGFIGRDIGARAGRIAGADRYRNAVAISKAAFPAGADIVLIASGDSFADALAAAPLADAYDAPILLSPGTSLTPETRAELRRLRCRTVILLGGTAALSEGVAYDARRASTVTNVQRLSGANRYETAAAIANRLRLVEGTSTAAVIVDANRFADGLSAGPLAASLNAPLLFVDGARVPLSTRAALRASGATTTIVVGGPSSVPTAALAAFPDPTRITGEDRYSVSAAVARYGLSGSMLPLRTVVATGRTYTDALGASVLAARLRGPLLVVAPDAAPVAASGVIAENADQLLNVWVVGGTASVSAATYDAIVAALNSTN